MFVVRWCTCILYCALHCKITVTRGIQRRQRHKWGEDNGNLGLDHVQQLQIIDFWMISDPGVDSGFDFIGSENGAHNSLQYDTERDMKTVLILGCLLGIWSLSTNQSRLIPNAAYL